FATALSRNDASLGTDLSQEEARMLGQAPEGPREPDLGVVETGRQITHLARVERSGVGRTPRGEPEVVIGEAGLDLAALDQSLVQRQGPGDDLVVLLRDPHDAGRVDGQLGQEFPRLLVEDTLDRPETPESVERFEHVADVAEGAVATLAERVPVDL